MNAERLAELRRSIDSDTYTNYLPKTVRELLDHIADLRQRPSDADALQKLLNDAYRKGNHDAHAARDACTVIMPESVPVAWIVGGIGGDHFTDFETAKTIAATYGKEPTPLYLHPQRGGQYPLSHSSAAPRPGR